MTADVLYESDGAARLVTFNRPAVRNALTWEMYDALYAACEDVDSDPAARVLVVRGAGRAFAAGTDITQFRHFQSADDGIAYERRIGNVLGRLQQVRVPSVAMIGGDAVGGGLAIAAACDLRFATPEARLGVPVARTLGNCVSPAACDRLVSLIGPAHTLELIYTAKLLDAQAAERIGLVNAVVPSEEIDAYLQALCARLSAHAPKTMWAAKEAVRRGRSEKVPDMSDVIAACYGSSDFREGVDAYLGKRSPVWTGR